MRVHDLCMTLVQVLPVLANLYVTSINLSKYEHYHSSDAMSRGTEVKCLAS